MTDPTARLAGNTPLPVEDKRLMDEGIAEKISLLCHIRKTPNVLYGMFLELTRQFYSDHNNIPIDTCAHWDPDPTKSSIWIDEEMEWDEENIEKRPAIYIKLGNITYKSLTGRHDSRMGVDLEQGEYKQSRNGEGTVTWVHIGSSKTEAAILAGSTLDYIDAFSWVIRDDLRFQTFELSSISPMAYEKEWPTRKNQKSVSAVWSLRRLRSKIPGRLSLRVQS
jgi:hypothetical protein